VVQDRAGVLKQDDLYPGQRIAVDHFVCSTKGRLFTSRGKTSDSEMFSGGCMFVDHASGYLHVEFQTNLNTHETLAAKESYELMCRDHGVIPQSYVSDNGSAFTSAGFTANLREFAQVIRFAGAGAHHHNGTAERAIQTIMCMARTMMLHAAVHWPDMADSSLWPMAVAHAVFLYNHVPSIDSGVSPIDLFTRSRWEQRKFHDLHVWGCPVYLLDKMLSDGKKLPRWKPRSKRTVYMGSSPMHASTVPLVLNPDSGAITAAFHVVFDDWFATVPMSEPPSFDSDDWSRLFGDSTYQYAFDDDDDSSSGDPSPVSQAALDARRESVARAMDEGLPATVLPVTPPPLLQPYNDESPVSRPPRVMSSVREPLNTPYTSTVPALPDTPPPVAITPVTPVGASTPGEPPMSPARELISPAREPVLSPMRQPMLSQARESPIQPILRRETTSEGAGTRSNNTVSWSPGTADPAVSATTR
jgi:hypothetical protein